MDFVIGFVSHLALLPHSSSEKQPISSGFPFLPTSLEQLAYL